MPSDTLPPAGRLPQDGEALTGHTTDDAAAPGLLIGLSVVIVAADGDAVRVMTTRRSRSVDALPFGAFDPRRHRTFELALRGWVKRQTGFELGYVEQLYTFGDAGRETPGASMPDAPASARVISVGYLALTPSAERQEAPAGADWRSFYQYFPWEDHRGGRPALLAEAVEPALRRWADGRPERARRSAAAFGLDGQDWREEAVLERYELLYEAGLVAERRRDSAGADAAADVGAETDGFGLPMASDHRRILATALGRLRGKVKYRPVLFQLVPEPFTLSALQEVLEALLGRCLHKQNFRRALSKTRLVEPTGEMEPSTGGRPAGLYRVRPGAVAAPKGVPVPQGRPGPG